MSSKHFIDNTSVEHLVADALESLVYQHPDLNFNVKQKVVFDSTHDGNSNVALISGGGAGHEPAHAMFVGDGMLTAAVSGNVFASPNVPQIVSAVRQVGGQAGTILIVKNYTGDVFNFYQAAGKARAASGLPVEVLVVGDDVSVGRTRSGKVGRRGLAGTVLVHKVLGAMAQSKTTTLEQCLAMGQKLVSGLSTVAASLDHVHVPGQPTSSTQHLKEGEIEVGMGIHNEPGVELMGPQPSLDELLGKMLGYLLKLDDPDRSYVDYFQAEELVLMVNNLGGLSTLELGAITTHVLRQLQKQNLRPSRVLSGTFMTSLNGPGFSITLLRADAEIVKLLDTPTSALGWTPYLGTSTRQAQPLESRIISTEPVDEKASERPAITGPEVNLRLFIQATSAACKSVITAEPDITRSDTIVGDGDCGTTLKRGAEAVLGYVERLNPQENAKALEVFLEVANLVEENTDGTSGAIYALFFNGLCSAIREKLSGTNSLGPNEFSIMAKYALEVVQKVTPARQGDRTLMDALEPFVYSLASGLENAVDAAAQGMKGTLGMRPAFGRAVYVNETGWETVPDPGAQGVVELVKGLRDGLK